MNDSTELFIPEYWDQDKEGAIDRAKETGNMVIKSRPPECNRHEKPGYWVDSKDSMIRPFEVQIYPSL